MRDKRATPSDPVPPSDEPAEAALLGSILLGGRDAWIAASAIVGESDFYADAHRAIWRGLASIAARGAIDAVILREELDRTGQLKMVGLDLLADVLNAVPTPAHVEHYAKIVRRLGMARECIRIGTHLVRLAYDRGQDPDDVIARASAALCRLSATGRSREIEPIGESLRGYVDGLTSGGPELIPFGFADLDSLLGGMGIGELTLVPARPSMGKSTFVKQVAAIAAARGTPTLIVSREESRQKIARNFLARECEIENRRLRRGQLGQDEIAKIAETATRVSAMPLYLVDSARSAEDIRSVVASAVAKHGARLVIIDYLQLIDAGGKSETERASLASRFCRSLLQEFPVALLCPCQLNRSVEHREDKRPGLADLRDSGQIEQDADLVLMLHREDYYHAHDPEYQPTHEAEVLIAKARDAGRGETIRLKTDLRYQRFSDAITIPDDMF